jgi:NADH dehydrogenase [ubiquinone] 1 alpha subcomplex assembly factor 7
MQKYISNIIKINGFIPLDEFIFMALCHSEYGYYAKQNPIKKDFITSPEISNAFGIIIANFIFNKILTLKNIEEVEKIHLIELGGGSGKLAFDVLNFLINLKKINNPKIDKIIQKLHFHSIEFSTTLVEIQKNTLYNVLIHKYFWSNIFEFSEFLENQNKLIKNKNNLCIFFSNEFFDALPIKQFLFDGSDFFEIIITEKNNNFIFEKIKINSEKLNLIHKNQKIKKNDILEIPFFGINILDEISKIMKNNKSIFLTFDYGFLDDQNTSTLQGIFNGSKCGNILENVGEMDITHLVSFTIFTKFFQRNSLQVQLQTQKEFLIQNGINELITPENQEGILRLISETKMGELFKVLISETLN